MLFALCMMVLFGVSGNLMSLGAIDFGLIVDGAVIIVEIVVRKLSEKVKETKASLTTEQFEQTVFTGAKEIMSSASFGQFIILIVYIPILVLAGIEGKMFRPMALTVIFAMAGAFILCLTYVPMMSAWVLSRNLQEKETFADRIIHRLKAIYHPALNWVLQHTRIVMISSLMLLTGAWLLFSQLGGEFIPELNEGDYAIETRMLPGVSLTQSLAVAKQVESMLMDSFPNEIKKCVSKIGTSEIPTDPMPLEAMDIIVVLKDRDEWKRASDKEELDMLLANALSQFPGVMFSLQQPIQMRFNELMTSAKTDVVVKLYGNDLSTLTKKADEIAAIALRIDGTGDVQVQKVEGLPQIQIEYNRSQLANYGITVQEVNDAIQTSYAGKKAGVIFEDDRRFDLMVRFAEPYRSRIESLNDLMITTQNGQQIPLKEVATIEIKNGPAEIARDNTKRRINIGFNARGRDVAGIVYELQSKVNAQVTLPAGYSLHYGGQFENLAHATKRLSIVLPIALIVIFFLLYLSFHSLKQCLLIFSAIPLAAVGGVVSLWLRDMPFSISAGVGFIALFGVAVLNGIVLIGYLNQLQMQGYDDVMTRIHKALDERFRPVIMTALVASLGFLPMALSHGAGAEVQKPLATVVVGGLITSTLLTLLVLPVLYYITHRSRKLKVSKAILVLFLFIIPALTQAQNESPTIDFCVKRALQYHPSLKAAVKFIEEQKGAKKAAFNPPTLDILIQSPTGKDYRPSILQTIDFPLVYARQIQAAGAAVEAAVIQQQLAEIILIRAVKEAYNEWLYEYERVQDLQLQDSLFFMMSAASAKRYTGGDIALLERMNAEAAYAIIHQELIVSETLMKNAGIRLQAITGLTQLARPPVSQSKSQTDSSWLYSANDKHPVIQLQDALIRSNEKEHSAACWRMAPGLSFGYFNQADGNLPNTYRWQFGLRVPVLFWGYSGKIAESKARLEKNRIERSYLLIKQNTEVTEAMNQLHASEKTLQYYETTGLKQAEELRRIAAKSLASGEIGFTVYANGMERAGRIRIAYLEALKNYNQSVYQLEFLKALVK
jgi:cobalt-zinc-cadmium resistance protein CzcA